MNQTSGKTTMRKHMSFDYLVETLVEHERIEEETAEALRLRESAARYRLEQQRGGSRTGRGSITSSISPVDVLTSLEVEFKDGKTLTEEAMMKLVAQAEGLTYHKIDPLELDAALITATMSRPFAQRHHLLPLGKQRGKLRVATDDPFNHDAFESVRTKVGSELEIVVSSRSDILRHIREVYGFRKTVAAAAEDLRAGTSIGNLEQLFKLKSYDELESNDQHIINAVEYLLHYAFDQRASDIHIEPKRDHALVRLRIDGMLHTIQRIPDVVHKAMLSRIKTMARLDIAEKRRPQDGRLKTRHHDAEIELRLSTLPVAFGEKLVIRIFDPQVLLQDLDNLGFAEEQLGLFRDFIDRPNGLVLVTGPTGSGKTTTLYSALTTLANDHVNITTIEDPIEMVVEEFNQTNILPRAGVTFASALRTLLRQDPDIIMVGEIRDTETARQAIQAALTGHLVLSTLHTNDSASAITRLLDLEMEPFLVASTLVGIVAQRLVRTICENCKQESALSPEQMGALGITLEDDDAAPQLPVCRGTGCVDCRHTGLRGRDGVFELMPVTDRIRRKITDGAPASDIMKVARQDGMATLRESAVRSLANGRTSFEEVLRVTNEV